MSIDLPRSLRDAGFRRRFAALARATTEAERTEVLRVPLVADRTFDAGREVDCPRGHVADHAADWPPVNHEGRPAIARACLRCGSTWLELLP